MLFTIVAYLSFNVQCRELLNDFLDFQDQSSKVFLTRTCVDDLRILRSAIEENKVWALKGNAKVVESESVLLRVEKFQFKMRVAKTLRDSCGEIVFGWAASELVICSMIRRRSALSRVRLEICTRMSRKSLRSFRLSIECSTFVTHRLCNSILICLTKVFSISDYAFRNRATTRKPTTWRQ